MADSSPINVVIDTIRGHMIITAVIVVIIIIIVFLCYRPGTSSISKPAEAMTKSDDEHELDKLISVLDEKQKGT